MRRAARPRYRSRSAASSAKMAWKCVGTMKTPVQCAGRRASQTTSCGIELSHDLDSGRRRTAAPARTRSPAPWHSGAMASSGSSRAEAAVLDRHAEEASGCASGATSGRPWACRSCPRCRGCVKIVPLRRPAARPARRAALREPALRTPSPITITRSIVAKRRIAQRREAPRSREQHPGAAVVADRDDLGRTSSAALTVATATPARKRRRRSPCTRWSCARRCAASIARLQAEAVDERRRRPGRSASTSSR